MTLTEKILLGYLGGNHPNPFNPEAEMKAEDSESTLKPEKASSYCHRLCRGRGLVTRKVAGFQELRELAWLATSEGTGTSVLPP